MVNFLFQIDNKFKSLLGKKTITKSDLLELKSYIIEAYENDGILNIKDLNNMQKTLLLDLYNA
jgi:hypothetical protein